MTVRDNFGAKCAITQKRIIPALAIALTVFTSTAFAGAATPAQRALEVAKILPARHSQASRQSDIAEAAEATISSVKGIVELMRQAQEVSAMLPHQNPEPEPVQSANLARALEVASLLPQRKPAKTGIERAFEVASFVPSRKPATPVAPKTNLELALDVAKRIPNYPAPSVAAKKPDATKTVASAKPAVAAAKPKPAASPPKPQPAARKPSQAPSAQPKQDISLPGSQRLTWPTDGLIYSTFNATRGRKRRHGAIDIVTKKGTPIAAAADGIVSVASNGGKNFSGYGKIVILDHGKGLYTVYAHCDTIIVKMGQKVKQGEYVGTVGRTGRATTDHVHFEVRIAGQKRDPLAYLPSRPEMVKATNYHAPSKKKKN